MVNPEYVDIKSALQRIGGSMDLYKRLLNQFTGGNHISPLDEALSIGAFDEVLRLTHALKGVSANLSLDKLSRAAAELEHTVKSEMDYSSALAELRNIYYETSQQISLI